MDVIMKKISEKALKILLLLLAAAFVALALYEVFKLVKLKKLEAEIDTQISASMSVSEYDRQIAKLESWAKEDISKAALGTVYNRLAYLNSQKGNWLGYYNNFGKAVYYLEAGGNYEDEVNLYCDLLFYTYLADGNVEYAKNTMATIDSITDEHGLEDLQILSQVTRDKALISYLEGKYEESVELAEKSKQYAFRGNGSYTEIYSFATDMIRAKDYIGMGNYSEAEKILDGLKDSGVFSMDVYLSTLNTIAIIPYYQARAYCAAHSGDEKTVISCVDEIISRSKEYSFSSAAYETIGKLEDDYRLSDETRTYLDESDLQVYKYYVDNRLDTYNSICEALIQGSHEEVRTAESHQSRVVKQTVSIAVGAAVIALMVIIMNHIQSSAEIDSLTGIYNRKTFDKDISKLERKETDYAVLMMDIDDFKDVNDRYGHSEGDDVLRHIGKLLKGYDVENKAASYRYGGEEFTLILLDEFIDKGKDVAESIRKEIERQTWKHNYIVTVSFGYARKDRKAEKSTVEAADDNLYYAKASGKNCVR